MKKISQEQLAELIACDNHSMTEARAQVIIAEMADNLNLPKVAHSDFATLMMKLYGSTKEIGGELVHIGRILIAKICEFIEENPYMTMGAIVGLILGAVVSVVPIVGGILQILATFCGIAIGVHLDKYGDYEEDLTFKDLMVGATEALKKFYFLIKEIFQALKSQK